MRKSEMKLFCISLSIALGLLPGFAHEGADVVEWYGYEDCIELENADCRVILTPSFGGKIMVYALHGQNTLVVDPAEEGFVYDPEADNRTFDGGGRFDFGPTAQFPNRRLYQTGKWTGEIVGDRRARLTSPVDPAAQLQMVREFVLDSSGAGLQVTQTIRNVGEQPASVFYWARTFALGHGIVVVPKTPPIWYRDGYARMEGSLLNANPKGDPAVVQSAEHTVVLDAPLFPKMGFDSTAGWCAYAMPNDLLMVRRFPVFPERMYGDLSGGFLSIYYNLDYLGKSVVEIEPIGPVELLQPSEAASFTERWELYEFPFPDERESFDLKDVLVLLR